MLGFWIVFGVSARDLVAGLILDCVMDFCVGFGVCCGFERAILLGRSVNAGGGVLSVRSGVSPCLLIELYVRPYCGLIIYNIHCSSHGQAHPSALGGQDWQILGLAACARNNQAPDPTSAAAAHCPASPSTRPRAKHGPIDPVRFLVSISLESRVS